MKIPSLGFDVEVLDYSRVQYVPSELPLSVYAPVEVQPRYLALAFLCALLDASLVRFHTVLGELRLVLTVLIHTLNGGDLLLGLVLLAPILQDHFP